MLHLWQHDGQVTLESYHIIIINTTYDLLTALAMRRRDCSCMHLLFQIHFSRYFAASCFQSRLFMISGVLLATDCLSTIQGEQRDSWTVLGEVLLLTYPLQHNCNKKNHTATFYRISKDCDSGTYCEPQLHNSKDRWASVMIEDVSSVQA